MLTKIGIISDTHNKLDDDVLRNLKGCSVILHAGDVCHDFILDRLRPLGRLYAVRGNCDSGRWAANLKRKLAFEIDGVRFLMVHEKFRAGADSEKADIIIYGHTHQYRLERKDGRIWLNPGSCEEPRYGAGRTMAIMTIEGGKITGIHKTDLDP